MIAGDGRPVFVLQSNPFPGGSFPLTPRLADPVGLAVTTLVISSAVSVGSNLVDVRNQSMTLPQAVLNGLFKGAAASLILHVTSRSTPLQVTMAAGVLAAAGFLIDSAMKKSKRELCAVTDEVKV